jgi:hypothetical protein
MHKLQAKDFSFIMGYPIKLKLPKQVPNAYYGLNCDLTYAM